jgi:hypothetical protein
VGEGEVGAGGGDQFGERVAVALDGGDAIRHAGFSGTAVEGGQGVGAGVDDGDRAAGGGQGHGQRAAAAAHVEHPGRFAGAAQPGGVKLGVKRTANGIQSHAQRVGP